MKKDSKETHNQYTNVSHNCFNCQFFQHEEIGDSDYGAVYSDTANCQKFLDTDPETEKNIPNFDREIERQCCELDFWKVVELDEKLSKKLADDNGKIDSAYRLFCKRYNYD